MRSRVRARALSSGVIAAVLGSLALYPWFTAEQARSGQAERLRRVERSLPAQQRSQRPLDASLSLRVRRLGALLASWESIGGCGAGSTGGSGVSVRWVGRSTSGGLVQSQFMGNYIPVPGGYNFVATAQVTRDLSETWNLGVVVPYLYKYYRDYAGLPVDISNAGLGDVNLLLTRGFGEIQATSLTLGVGLPTGSHDATYKMDLLTQEKQLGFGRVTGGLMLDHTMDEIWGIIGLGAAVGYRGGENELGSYRAPTASAYGYVGYFLGPFVPSLGLSVTGFAERDRDRGIEQDVPLAMVAGNASIEWSSDYVAILAGGSLPYSLLAFERQPWMVALGVSVSPF